MAGKTLASATYPWRNAALACVAALVFPLAVNAQAVPANDPQDQRAELIRAFAGAVDGETMARDAAGRHWAAMSRTEQARYVELFRRHLIALIGDLLPRQLSGSEAEPISIKLPGGDTLARTYININGEQVPIGIRLRGENIVDVTMDSASLMEVKRSEITSLAGRGGIAAVLQALELQSGSVSADTTGPIMAPVSAPAAPQPVASVTPGVQAKRQVVYFPYGSAAVPPAARESLVEIAQAAAAATPAVVRVTGYADPSGSPDYNEALSQKRAEDVARTLVAAGVPREKIHVEGRGEARPAQSVIPEAERRRVEVSLIPVT